MSRRWLQFPLTGRRPTGAAWGRLCLAGSALFFGAMAVLARDASRDLGPAQIMLVRFALGLLGVLGVTAWRPHLFHASKPGGLVLRGLLGAVSVLGYFTALHHLNAGLGSLLNYLFPLWAALFAGLFLGEKLSAWAGIGMLIATAGLVVVVGPGVVLNAMHGVGDPSVRIGLMMGLAGSVAGGAATTVVRWLRRTESALAILASLCTMGMLVSLPLALHDWRPVSGRDAWLLLGVGALSFGAQSLFTYALKFVTAGAGAVTTQLTVVTTYGFAALFIGEAIPLSAVLGGALVTAGVLVVARKGDPEPESLPLPAAEPRSP